MKSQLESQPITRHTSSFVPKKKIGVKQTISDTQSSDTSEIFERQTIVSSPIQKTTKQSIPAIKNVKKTTQYSSSQFNKPLPQVRSTVSVASTQRNQTQNTTTQGELFDILSKRRQQMNKK